MTDPLPGSVALIRYIKIGCLDRCLDKIDLICTCILNPSQQRVCTTLTTTAIYLASPLSF